MLFSLYINDLADVLDSDNISHILYADDLQIYTQVSIAKIKEGIEHLTAAAQAVSGWAADAGLHLNVKKTNAIVFGSVHNMNEIKELNLPGIELETGACVPFSDAVKNLGVIMDSKLTWKPHIEYVTSKVNRALYSLRFFRPCTTESLRQQLANALITPLIDYCSLAYLNLTLDLRTILQRLQNSCVRYICDVKRDEHITRHRLALGWLSVDLRRRYFAGLLMYLIIRIGQPPYLAESFVRNLSRSSSRTSNELVAVKVA